MTARTNPGRSAFWKRSAPEYVVRFSDATSPVLLTQSSAFARFVTVATIRMG